MAIPEKLRIRVNLIAFLLIAFGLLYLMATQVLSILAGTYSVYAIFPDAGGVFTNQEVTYRGLTVGKVGEMSVVRDGVKIELIIEEGIKVPSEDVQARVMFKSAVGEQFVDLLPTTDDAPYLENGSEIPIDQTSIPVSTQALLTTTQAVLEGIPPEALHNTIESLAQGLAGEGRDIALLLESMADLADLFADRAPEIVGILRNGTTVGDAFLRSKEDFANAIRDLIQVADLLADNRPNIDRLLKGSNLLSDELVAMIRENRKTLNQVIVELAEINDFQADASEDLNELIRKLPQGLERVTRTFESKTGLVRFGLVQDSENHACDYTAVDRRPPQDRRHRLPPKHAVCKDALSDESGGAPSEDASRDLGLSPTSPDLSGPYPDDTGHRIPERMRHMGWMFFYLNALR